MAESFAPPGVLPDLPRNQVPIASNLIIDPEGKIQFYSLLDSANFDARLVALQARLEALMKERKPPVVSVAAPDSLTLARGESAEARLAVTVAPGFHVQANPASEPFLVPLSLALDGKPPVETGPIAYPSGRPYRLRGASFDLSTYEGTLELRVPLSIAASAPPGEVRLEGDLRYQACDERMCLRPASIPVALTVRVAAGTAGRPHP